MCDNCKTEETGGEFSERIDDISNGIKQLRDTIIEAIDDFEKIKSLTDNEEIHTICNEWLDVEQNPDQKELEL